MVKKYEGDHPRIHDVIQELEDVTVICRTA